MPQTSQFTVLIENRRLTRVALTLTALTALALASLAAPPAHAARLSERPAHSKLAGDLTQAIDGSNVSQHRWAREKGGQRFVQAIIVSDSADPELTDLRRHIERIGGEVLVRHGIIRGLTVQVPAKQLRQLAQRDDVVHIAPNRATRSTASTLERVSGALGTNGRPTSTKKTYTGLDGRGIGIAILDSGVERNHLAFRNAANQTRVLRNVNMLNTAVGEWSTGNSNISFEPGSDSQIGYEAAINNASATVQDGYGHGTHVASLAAGFAVKVKGSTPDITGIAPSANIYDVKVTSSNGTGTVSARAL